MLFILLWLEKGALCGHFGYPAERARHLEAKSETAVKYAEMSQKNEKCRFGSKKGSKSYSDLLKLFSNWFWSYMIPIWVWEYPYIQGVWGVQGIPEGGH